ncbi:hypothetical protein BKA70DRAFT_1428183 [Coprinopsis sp. MPI-PUGE-AT-0042]|nr:hypothetical protein BKA70DRAFT_1428183 [Coprinopsis sp. MPI-PUGE-AT-0042]
MQASGTTPSNLSTAEPQAQSQAQNSSSQIDTAQAIDAPPPRHKKMSSFRRDVAETSEGTRLHGPHEYTEGMLNQFAWRVRTDSQGSVDGRAWWERRVQTLNEVRDNAPANTSKGLLRRFFTDESGTDLDSISLHSVLLSDPIPPGSPPGRDSSELEREPLSPHTQSILLGKAVEKLVALRFARPSNTRSASIYDAINLNDHRILVNFATCCVGKSPGAACPFRAVTTLPFGPFYYTAPKPPGQLSAIAKLLRLRTEGRAERDSAEALEALAKRLEDAVQGYVDSLLYSPGLEELRQEQNAENPFRADDHGVLTSACFTCYCPAHQPQPVAEDLPPVHPPMRFGDPTVRPDEDQLTPLCPFGDAPLIKTYGIFRYRPKGPPSAVFPH